GWTASQSRQVWSEAAERRSGWRWREGGRTESGEGACCQGRRRKEIILDRKIDNVTAAESLQKGRACRFPLRESGGRAPYFHRDEVRQVIAGGTDCLHRDREIARRLRFSRSVRSFKQGARECPAAVVSTIVPGRRCDLWIADGR